MSVYAEIAVLERELARERDADRRRELEEELRLLRRDAKMEADREELP